MREPIGHQLTKTEFAIVQVASWGLAVIPPKIGEADWTLAPVPLLFLVGVVMGFVGLARCVRNGQGLERLVGSILAILLASTVFWFVCLFAVTQLLSGYRAFSDYGRWEPVLYLPLVYVTTGSLAYFGLGPFHSQVTAGQIVRKLISRSYDLRAGGPLGLEVVAKAEQVLGLWLPMSFREFLLDFGEVRGLSVNLLGLGPTTDLDHPSKDDFVGATLDARARLGLPQGYIVCSADAKGVMACLDTTATETEPPVVLWSSVTRAVVRVAARSFPKYVIDALRARRPT